MKNILSVIHCIISFFSAMHQPIRMDQKIESVGDGRKKYTILHR